MAKYLVAATYNAEGAAGLARDGGTGRRNAVETMVRDIGGRVESFYFALGETDAYVILDLPDNVTASALSLAVNRSGAVKLTTTPLLTTDEVDQAIRQSINYRAPG